MKCFDGRNTKVYNLTASKNMPDWLTKKKKKKDLKKNDDEIIQDFQMPDVSTSMKLSPDGQYLMVAGTYKPVLKCYDLSELSVKFERGMDADVLRIEVLSEDYGKLAFLQDERYIELHGQNGKVDRFRVPRFGRDLVYHSPSTDLFISTSGNELYRLNLFQGRFLNVVTTEAPGINRLLCNKYLNLMSWGTDAGVIQYWDPRSRSIVASLNCAKHMAEYINSNCVETKSSKDLQITSMAGHGAFTLGVGNHSGQIYMYDIRSTSPFLIKDHYTNAPIDELHFHSSGSVFSMAPSIVKIWDRNTGTAITSIEGESVFNDMAVVPGTGLAFFAAEHRKMKAYFIPSLGPAPSWCAHLDAMTEEMEEDETSAVASQFDDYTFVTMEDLIELGLKDLVGSSMLRAVMHGYYINTATYNKVKSMANPVRPQKVIEKKIKKAIEQENTIKLQREKVETSVNGEILQRAQEEKAELVPDLLHPMFASLFTDPKLKIDPNMERSAVKYTNLSTNKTNSSLKKRTAEIAREEAELQPAQEEEKEDSSHSDADSVIDDFGSDRSSLDSEDEEERQKLSKMFKSSRGTKKRRFK